MCVHLTVTEASNVRVQGIECAKVTPGLDQGQSATLTSVIDWKRRPMVLCCFPVIKIMVQAAQFCARLASCCKDYPSSRVY